MIQFTLSLLRLHTESQNFNHLSERCHVTYFVQEISFEQTLQSEWSGELKI